MATKKPTREKPTAKPQPPPGRLTNLASKPTSFDDTIDEQLVDHSGVFRVTSAIAQAQQGHDEEAGMRFPNDSLVMQAQRAGFRETPEDTIDETVIDAETTAATKRQRLATLAALAARKQKRR